jgi:hypothetical protein
LEPFQIFTRICGEIQSFVCIAGVNNTDNMLFTGVNDTGGNISPVSLTPVIFIDPMTPTIKLLPVSTTSATINHRVLTTALATLAMKHL